MDISKQNLCPDPYFPSFCMVPENSFKQCILVNYQIWVFPKVSKDLNDSKFCILYMLSFAINIDLVGWHYVSFDQEKNSKSQFPYFWVYGGQWPKFQNLYFIHVGTWLKYNACILHFLSHILISFWSKFTVNWSQMVIFLKQVLVQV